MQGLRADNYRNDHRHEGQQLQEKGFFASGQWTIRKMSWTMGISKQPSPHQMLSRNAATRNQSPPIRKRTKPNINMATPIALESMSGDWCLGILLSILEPVTLWNR
jgi:hypothetical protein